MPVQPQHWKPVRLIENARADVEQQLDVFTYDLVAGIAHYVEQRLVGELDHTIVGKGKESARRGVNRDVRALCFNIADQFALLDAR